MYKSANYMLPTMVENLFLQTYYKYIHFTRQGDLLKVHYDSTKECKDKHFGAKLGNSLIDASSKVYFQMESESFHLVMIIFHILFHIFYRYFLPAILVCVFAVLSSYFTMHFAPCCCCSPHFIYAVCQLCGITLPVFRFVLFKRCQFYQTISNHSKF